MTGRLGRSTAVGKSVSLEPRLLHSAAAFVSFWERARLSPAGAAEGGSPVILPELLCRRYSGMDSTYLSMAGSSSHAFTLVKEAQGSELVAWLLGLVGVSGSLLGSTDDVSAIEVSVNVKCRQDLSVMKETPTGSSLTVNSSPFSHRRLGLGLDHWFSKHPRGLRLLVLPGENRLRLLEGWGGLLMWYLIPHVLRRTWVPYRRDEWGRIGRHMVMRLLEVESLGLRIQGRGLSI